MNIQVDPAKAGSRPPPFSHSRGHSYSHTHPAGAADTKIFSASAAKATKGKHKSEENWPFGWWDYAPLLEARKPPVQWTSSSLIVTAHATEPRVICTHFPSNRHFVLPGAPSLTASPASYEPPTVIAASARGDWIFAYFPGIDVDGVGCLWNKQRRIDDWVIKEWPTFARGDAVVSARWLNPDREWVSADTGVPVRLPTLGPFFPLTNPVLFVVTETHLCNVYYTHTQFEQVKMLSASLSRRSSSQEGQKRLPGERIDGSRGLGRCVHAAIGFGYDESSILIATYSSFVPSPPSELVSSQAADLTMSLGMTQPLSEPVMSSEWETWRDDSIIEVCEVNISTQGFLLSLSTTPLPSIRVHSHPSRSLTDLTFVPALPSPLHVYPFPSTPTQTHRHVTPQSSPAMVHTHVTQSPGRVIQRSPAKGTPPKSGVEKMKGKPMTALYLLCTTLELGEYASTPSSEVTLYIFWRNPAELAMRTWYYKRASQLTVPSGVITHISPSQPTNSSQHVGALLGVLDTKGQILKRKEGQGLSVGRLQMLRLPELQIDESWESTSIMCSIGPYGAELPFSMAVSPNKTLVCAAPSSVPTAIGSTSVHPHPCKVLHGAQDLVAQRARKQFAASLELAVQRRVMPSDIIHLLVMQTNPVSIVEEVLSFTLSNLDTNGNGQADLWINEVIGAAVEIYCTRSLSTLVESEKDDMDSRLKVGLEICSLAACNIIWEEAFDGKGYDLEAVVYLTSLCAYFVELSEKLLKECVELAGDGSLRDGSRSASASGEISRPLDLPKLNVIPDDDPFSANPASRSPLKQPPTIDLSCSLTHIVHPYALDNFHCFLQHMRRFRAHLGSTSRSDEHHQMAKEMLIDTVDSSGIDLEALDKMICEIKDEVNTNAERTPDLARRCLVGLKPPIQYTALLQKITVKIMQAQIVDKSRLFIKPGDLADCMLGLSVGTHGKLPDRDIISKGFLTSLKSQISCVRCNGRSEITSSKVRSVPGHASVRWLVWERLWQAHCVCGGQWSNKL
ncbi:hypothetical protein M0805_003433 [Coniferiporia weirii]|nr:hypothetical protein M0805_003433 [Coniferiporia weirii]